MLQIGRISINELADRFGTPFYVYDAAVIRAQIARVKDAFKALPFQPFYAMKANGALAILRLVREAGFGCDCVAPGEIFIVNLSGRGDKDVAQMMDLLG